MTIGIYFLDDFGDYILKLYIICILSLGVLNNYEVIVSEIFSKHESRATLKVLNKYAKSL